MNGLEVAARFFPVWIICFGVVISIVKGFFYLNFLSLFQLRFHWGVGLLVHARICGWAMLYYCVCFNCYSPFGTVHIPLVNLVSTPFLLIYLKLYFVFYFTSKKEGKKPF